MNKVDRQGENKISYTQVYTCWQRMSPVWFRHKNKQDGYNILIGGLFQWLRVFDADPYVWFSPGKVKNFRGEVKDIESFDYIHINLSGDGKDLPIRIRKSIGNNSKTKIVVNVDYGISIWKDVMDFCHPEEILNILDLCDYIFAVEPEMAYLLEVSLKRPVACIPHPLDVDMISQFKIPSFQRQKRVLIMFHDYDKNYYLPYFAVRELPLEKYCVNATPDVLEKSNFLYQQVIPRGELPFEMLINPRLQHSVGIRGGILSESYLAYDTYIVTGFGRFPVECAALEVPCVGSKSSLSQRILWPKITTEINAVGKQKKLLEKLLNDKDFYKEVTSYAFEKCFQFNLENSKNRFLSFLRGEEYLDYKSYIESEV